MNIEDSPECLSIIFKYKFIMSIRSDKFHPVNISTDIKDSGRKIFAEAKLAIERMRDSDLIEIGKKCDKSSGICF